MYEHALKVESEYRQYISGEFVAEFNEESLSSHLLFPVVIQGVNITHMSTQIKTSVDVEQRKILWVPTNNS